MTVIDSQGAACETLRVNKRNFIDHVEKWKIVEEDISELDFSGYTDLDLLSGGPPCQPFSTGGKRHGRDDERDMFPHFVRALRETRPKSFIIENVKGLLDRNFYTYFDYLRLQLTFPEVEKERGEKWTEHRARLEALFTGGHSGGLHYNVIHQVLNAANFGVGQRRERVFVVGLRADLGIEYSFPLPTHSRQALLVDQWVTHDYWERHAIPASRRPEVPEILRNVVERLPKESVGMPWQTVRDTVRGLPRIAIGQTSHEVANHFLNPGARVYKGHTGSPMDMPAKTIKAGQNGVPGGENIVRLDNGSVRYFSVRECARLQAFPDDWEFDGSWCKCMHQIGNAVPVTLGEVVAKALADKLIAHRVTAHQQAGRAPY